MKPELRPERRRLWARKCQDGNSALGVPMVLVYASLCLFVLVGTSAGWAHSREGREEPSTRPLMWCAHSQSEISHINPESTAQSQNLTTGTVLTLLLKEKVSSLISAFKMTPKCHFKSIGQTEAYWNRKQRNSSFETWNFETWNSLKIEANMGSPSDPQIGTETHEDLPSVLKIDKFFNLEMHHLIGGGETLWVPVWDYNIWNFINSQRRNLIFFSLVLEDLWTLF